MIHPPQTTDIIYRPIDKNLSTPNKRPVYRPRRCRFFPIEGQEEACQDTDSVYSEQRFASLNEWSMAGTQALFRHENFVQTTRFFCIKIFLVANKPSISRFAKNHQTADNQPFAKNNPLFGRQKPSKSIAFTR